MRKRKSLNISKITPGMRMCKLINTIKGMSNNETIIIKADFDLQLFYKLMDGEFGFGLELTYMEAGPEIWKIKLTKNEILRSHHNAKKQSDNHSRSDSLDNNIESFKGYQNFENFNHIHKIWLNPDLADSLLSHNHWSISYLVNYIISSIHSDIVQLFVEINFYTERLNLAIETKSHAVIDLIELFNDFKDILINHLQKEEGILFPIFLKFDNIEKNPTIKSNETIGNAIKMMEHEHELIRSIINDLKFFLNQYNASQKSRESNTTMLIYLVEILEKEILFLIDLEDRILYPKVEKLELKINSKNR